jgi:hypothetical protein
MEFKYMKSIFILALTFLTWEAFATCSSPISRTAFGPNTVIQSTTMNTQFNNVYNKVNDLDGDCISDSSIPTAKYEDASITKAKLANGAKDLTVAAKTAAYTMTASDEFVHVDATSGAVTISLPTAVGITGRRYTVKKVDSSSNKVTIDASSTETIDGALTKDLSSRYQTIDIVSNGSNWLTTAGTQGANSIVGFNAPKTCYFAFGQSGSTLASPVVYSSGTAQEVNDSCATATMPTFSATGVYINLTFADGTWANSTLIDCTCQAWATGASSPRSCIPSFDTGDNTWSTTSTGGYVLGQIQTYGSSGVAANTFVIGKCTAEAP